MTRVGNEIVKKSSIPCKHILWRKFSNVLPFKLRRLVIPLVFVLSIARQTLMNNWILIVLFTTYLTQKAKKKWRVMNNKLQVQSNFVTSEGSWKSAASHTEYQCKGRQLYSDSKIVICILKSKKGTMYLLTNQADKTRKVRIGISSVLQMLFVFAHSVWTT